MTNVAMISRGRFRLLSQCLESLYANTPRKDFNAVVVSDSEDDFRCTRLLRKYAAEESNFCLVEVQNSGHVLAQLKNLAVFYSRQRWGASDWLYVGDSDTAFLPNWMEQMTRAFTGAINGLIPGMENMAVIGGQIHPFHQPIAGPFPSHDPRWRTYLTEHSVLDGPSWLMRWDTWRDIGPLSRKCAPGTCQSEDAQWCGRLVSKGYRIGVISPHVVIHAGLTNTKGEDCVGRKEREAMIPPGVIAE